MAYQLQSEFFTRDPEVRARCQACLDRPLAHIKRGNSGPAVSQIQAALFVIDGLSVDEKEIGRGFYGDSTANAVRAYKSNKPKRWIVNQAYQPAPDDIVGQMTMESLDREMAEKKKPEPINDLTRDMIIRILGQDPRVASAGKPTDEGEAGVHVPNAADFRKLIETDKYMKTHADPVLINFFGGGGAANRLSDPTSTIVELVKAQQEELGPIDKIGIFGFSIGGRNAATLSRALTKEKFSVAYLGIADAAFDSATDPERTSVVGANIGDNFYEAVSNGLPGVEFHGDITGCNNNRFDAMPGKKEFYLNALKDFFISLDPRPQNRGQKFFNLVHTKAVTDGYAETQLRLRSIFGCV